KVTTPAGQTYTNASAGRVAAGPGGVAAAGRSRTTASGPFGAAAVGRAGVAGFRWGGRRDWGVPCQSREESGRRGRCRPPPPTPPDVLRVSGGFYFWFNLSNLCRKHTNPSFSNQP